MKLASISNKALNNKEISKQEALFLFKEVELFKIAKIADQIRYKKHAEKKVSFAIDRNINYTNVCETRCKFCAFSCDCSDKQAFTLTYPQIKEKIVELEEIGGTHILMQGGHNPNLKIQYYEEIFNNIKKDFPKIKIHSLSPSEILYISKISKISLEETLERLKVSGLDSIPGGGAEILIDRVRNLISPKKITSENWLKVMEIANKINLKASATMMFGHLETIEERIEHLAILRDFQSKTNMFRAFIPWNFQYNSKIELKSLYTKEEAIFDYLRTVALSRIFLNNFDNIQASWVTQGFEIGQISLFFGVNDFGGIMMEENVVASAGSIKSSSNKEELIRQIEKAGFKAFQRDSEYNFIDS